jgi:hypothetical protein
MRRPPLTLAGYEFIDWTLADVRPNADLRRDLAPVLPSNRTAVCALARDKHNWPLNKYFCAEQVELLAIFLARRDYFYRVNYFVVPRLLRRRRSNMNRKFGRARGIDRKSIGIYSMFKRVSYASVAAQLDYEECDALLAVVERRYAAMYPRHKGALPRVGVEIRKLLVVAGLPERQAERYAKEIVAQHCLPVLEKQEKYWERRNNSTRS